MNTRSLLFIGALAAAYAGCGSPTESDGHEGPMITYIGDRPAAPVEEPTEKSLLDIGSLVGGDLGEVSGTTPVERMHSVCSTKRLSFEEGLASLHVILPYWVEEGMNHGGVIYVRAGRTKRVSVDGVSGYKCTGRADPFWAKRALVKHDPEFELPESCSTRMGSGDCSRDMRELYQSRIVNQLEGVLCGDCTSFMMQLYDCAWGGTTPFTTDPLTAPVVAASPGLIEGYEYDSNRGGYKIKLASWRDERGRKRLGQKGVDFGTCWSTIEDQLDGKLLPGDLIQFFEPGHFVVYTGGLKNRHGKRVNYELVEVGAYAFTTKRIQRGNTRRMNGKRMAGMRTVESAREALSGSRVDRGCVVRRVSKRPRKFNHKAARKSR